MAFFRASAEERRIALTAGAAVLAHVVVFALGIREHGPHRAPSVLEATSRDDVPDAIEIAVLTEPPHAPHVESHHDTTAAAAAITRHPSLAASRGSTSRSSDDVTPETEGASRPAGAVPQGSSAPVLLFTPPPTAIGLAGDGPNPFAASGPERVPGAGTFRSAAPDAPTTADAKRAVEQSLKNGMRARDADVGLGPEGPVLRALEDATSAGLSPERGGAMFLAVVDARGLVVDLRLLSASGGDWSDVRRRAARALTGTKLTLRGAKGAELKIKVESDVRLPSGNKPGQPVRPSFSESHVVLPENAPGRGSDGVVHTRTLATFDLTDIAAKPRRVVHAHLAELTTL